MLDTNTKKRIDDCRDILVGKLPDPKAQIEQITIALTRIIHCENNKLGAKCYL